MATTSTTSPGFSGYFYVVAWLLTILLLFLATKTKIGYTIVYIFVVASIIIVLAVGSPTITNIFQQTTPGSNSPAISV